jgi:GNAT superfamily N-acetyltransferase
MRGLYNEDTMLDYTLVSTKATYRPLSAADVPAFIGLVARCRREEVPGEPLPPERVIALLHELARHKDRGALLVFEAEESLVGYALLRNRWSMACGGPELAIDELYVAPEHRPRGIAADFVALLKKVAPQECLTIRWEVPRADRKGMAASRELGFTDTGRAVLAAEVDRAPGG